jgi:hypothetical protein
LLLEKIDCDERGERMSEHKLAWALRAAADDADARFTAGIISIATIETVMRYPEHDWKLVEKPTWQKEKDAFDRGETIEYSYDEGQSWYVATTPFWCESTLYRIKPKIETRWLWANRYGDITTTLHTKQPYDSYTIKLDWSRTDIEVKE